MDNKRDLYHRCTSGHFKPRQEDLCDKCPILSQIAEDIPVKIIEPALQKKAILTSAQFAEWINECVEYYSTEMTKLVNNARDHNNEDRNLAGIWNYCYHWSIACIKAFNSLIETPVIDAKPSLSISQIALIHFYQNMQITRSNCEEIVRGYGYNSGEKLFQKYTYFSSRCNRIGEPISCTPKKLRNKIELLKSIINLIPDDKQQEITQDIMALENKYNTKYL